MLVNVFCFLAGGCGVGECTHFPLPVPSVETGQVCSLCSLVNKDQVKTRVLLKNKIESHAL